MTSSADQFSRTAAAYLASAVHARGEDLLALVELARPLAPRVALDVGTNVGHTLRAIAPHARFVVGSDVAVAALRLARDTTDAPNVAFVEADAAALPFRDGSVDLVTCRLAAHHFPDAPRAFAELARVLAPGGTLLLADNYAPDDPTLDAFINKIERLRDRTHVRVPRAAEWLALAARAGLDAREAGRWRATLVTEEWLERARTAAPDAERVRTLLRSAAPAARDVFAIRDDRSDVLKVLIAATKPA